MKPEAQRIAIAEALGWKLWDGEYMGGCEFSEHILKWISPEGRNIIGPYPKTYLPFPDYLNDLNAMHEAEELLDVPDEHGRDLWGRYHTELARYGAAGVRWCIHPRSKVRAEAFLRTIGKWVESEVEA